MKTVETDFPVSSADNGRILPLVPAVERAFLQNPFRAAVPGCFLRYPKPVCRNPALQIERRGISGRLVRRPGLLRQDSAERFQQRPVVPPDFLRCADNPAHPVRAFRRVPRRVSGFQVDARRAVGKQHAERPQAPAHQPGVVRCIFQPHRVKQVDAVPAFRRNRFFPAALF